MARQQAILIIGPTASGKTPLGDLLQEKGLWGRRCFHFDFGDKLRTVVERDADIGISESEADFIKGLLQRGALLENETFYLAEKILTYFIASSQISGNDLVVLNGLPRHIGQALGIDHLLNVVALVSLECTPEVVQERIRINSGGDRTTRVDDDLELVKTKLEIFAERTRPLITHYQTYGTRLLPVPIGVETQASDVLALLNAAE